MRFAMMLLLGGMLAVSGLGCYNQDRGYLYQTRYIPTESDIDFDDPAKELPYKPPALNNHYSASTDAYARPMLPEINAVGVGLTRSKASIQAMK